MSRLRLALALSTAIVAALAAGDHDWWLCLTSAAASLWIACGGLDEGRGRV